MGDYSPSAVATAAMMRNQRAIFYLRPTGGAADSRLILSTVLVGWLVWYPQTFIHKSATARCTQVGGYEEDQCNNNSLSLHRTIHFKQQKLISLSGSTQDHELCLGISSNNYVIILVILRFLKKQLSPQLIGWLCGYALELAARRRLNLAHTV